MGTTTLRQFLESVCCNSPWNYAVFWKHEPQNQMVLTWEDGFCHNQIPGDSMNSILDNLFLKGLSELSSNSESSIHDGNLGEYPIGLAVAEMSNVHYALGEGIVGEVAYTGNHCWIFSDSILSGELIPKCPDEWLLQFVAGIKTILLVPLVPHGVLQLGSLCTVAEDSALVACLINKYNDIQTWGYSIPLPSNQTYPAQTSSLPTSILTENVDESSAISMNVIKFEDSNSVGNVKPTNQRTPLCMVQDSCNIFEKYMPKIRDDESENHNTKPPSQSLHSKHVEMTGPKMFGFSCLEEEIPDTSCSNFYNLGVFGDYAHEMMSTYSDEGPMGQPFLDEDANQTDSGNGSSFFSFSRDGELHKALGPPFLDHTDQYLWDLFISREDVSSSSNIIWNGDCMYNNEPSAFESSGLYIKGSDAEHLLEAVIANGCSGSDYNSSKGPNSTKSHTTSSGQCDASTIAQSQSEGSCLVENVLAPWSRGTNAFVARGETATTNSYPSASSFESMMSALVEGEPYKKGSGYLKPQKGSTLSKFSKRRVKSGENNKPRPRDRQLIQDRVKELRELVPNGTKCSIDGLLDRTIKHMQFLRSVTDRADKLGQRVDPVVSNQRNKRTPEINVSRQNGTSWAYELGSEAQLRPIVVEDLEYPGHMLIEMACNDHGRFLEIADAIQRLELTILKGVMENRLDRSWAHFIVEASRGFHRLDIFWPLMRLLQQNQAPISSKI